MDNQAEIGYRLPESPLAIHKLAVVFGAALHLPLHGEESQASSLQ